MEEMDMLASFLHGVLKLGWHSWVVVEETEVFDPHNPRLRTATRVEMKCRYCRQRAVRIYT
jgi:hypothetical protein